MRPLKDCSRQMKRKDPVKQEGFTLIELLVVIAIIALLAAILIPVLHRARMQGQRVVCAANIRDMGRAIYLYGHDYDGLLPPMNEDRRRQELGQVEGHYTRWFRSGDGTWWNLGFIWRAGIIRDGEVFYCPSPDVRFKYKDYSEPNFPSSSPLEANPGTRVSYMYNPVCVSLNDRHRRFNNLSQLKADKTLLVCDSVLDGSVPHMGGWNVMVGDFSVHQVFDPRIVHIMEEYSSGIGKTDYVHFDQALDLMLAEIQ